jgi:hypothetical protein
MLSQQHAQHPVRWNKPNQAPVFVHDRDARLPAAHHLPGNLLLVDTWTHDGRIRIHHVPDAVEAGSGEHALDRQHPDQHTVGHHCHVVSAFELRAG